MPCPNCGSKSLAEIVDHSCRVCHEIYEYCPGCIVEEHENVEILIAKTAYLEHEFDENE